MKAWLGSAIVLLLFVSSGCHDREPSATDYPGCTWVYEQTRAAAIGGFAELANGQAFAAGTLNGHWTVRKRDATGTWSDADRLDSGNAVSLLASPAGDLFAGGYGLRSSYEKWLIRKSADGGATWQRVDDLGELDSSVSSMTIGSDGAIYAAGYSSPHDFCNSVSMIRKSTDRGASWSTIYQGQNGSFSMSIASAPDGALWLTEELEPDGRKQYERWARISRSLDQGATWRAMNQYRLGGTEGPGLPRALAAGPANGVWLLGGTADDYYGWGRSSWFLKSSLDGGASWEGPSLPATSNAFGGQGDAISVSAGGMLFLAGADRLNEDASHWVVRSGSGDGNWSVRDDVTAIHCGKPFSATASAILAAGSGRIYAGGSAQSAWTVRTSSDSGASWNTEDVLGLLDETHCNDAPAPALVDGEVPSGSDFKEGCTGKSSTAHASFWAPAVIGLLRPRRKGKRS